MRSQWSATGARATTSPTRSLFRCAAAIPIEVCAAETVAGLRPSAFAGKLSLLFTRGRPGPVRLSHRALIHARTSGSAHWRVHRTNRLPASCSITAPSPTFARYQAPYLAKAIQHIGWEHIGVVNSDESYGANFAIQVCLQTPTRGSALPPP